MYFLYVGLTHKNAPIHIRETVHFSQDTLSKAIKCLAREKSVLENMIVSTCNRTEIYLVVDQLHTGKYYAKHFLANWFNIDVNDLEPYLVYKEKQDVLRHLFSLSVGLESKIIGETQILGQLKQAFSIAQQQNATGILLNNALKQAVTFSKQMHQVYRINERPASVSLTAMQTLDRLSFSQDEKVVALIGVGKMGSLVAKYLKERAFKHVHVFNRTIEKAQAVASEANWSFHALSELTPVLKEVDIVFSAITSDTFIVLPNMLKKGAIVFDLGVPRTVHPSETSTLYDIDSLSNALDQYNEERLVIADKIKQTIEEEIDKFYEWRKQLGIVPLIKQLRERSLQAQENAFESLMKKIPNLAPREQKQVQKHMKSIVNQLLKEPILQLKEMSVGENSMYDIALVAKIFGLQEEIEEVYEND